MNRLLLGLAINLCNVCEKVEDTAGVTPLVVVPGNQLDEVLVEGDASLGIEDGGVGIAVQVGGDDIILSVGRGCLDLLALDSGPLDS